MNEIHSYCNKTVTVIKPVWFWPRNRQVDQWTETEDLEIDKHKYENTVHNKVTMSTQK